MSWQAIARKDFQDSIRSRTLWVVSALFLVVFVVPAYFFAQGLGGGQDLTSDSFINLISQFISLIVPGIAVLLGYAAVAGERDSGTLKLLLSLPHSRRDLIVGKLVGRSGVIVIPVLVGFVATAVVFLITPVSLSPGTYTAFALLSALLGVVFVSIAVGISAAASTRRRAMVGNVGIYVIFALFWGSFASGLVNLLNEYTGIGFRTLVQVQLATLLFNPTELYQTLAAILWTPGPLAARLTAFGGGLMSQIYAQALSPLPGYFANPVVAVAFLAWLIVPPVLGYLAFREADL